MGQSNYAKCLEVVLQYEGGKVDHPNDKGGRTAFGVTQRNFDAWLANNRKPTRDVWTITKEEISAFYHEEYWVPCRCDLMPMGVDMVVFDASVNHGVSRAIKWVQRYFKLEEVGSFGPKTTEAMRSLTNPEHFISWYLSTRREFFGKIVERDPSQVVFLKGWMNRVNKLEQIVSIR